MGRWKIFFNPDLIGGNQFLTIGKIGDLGQRDIVRILLQDKDLRHRYEGKLTITSRLNQRGRCNRRIVLRLILAGFWRGQR
jgi:hypothetical protein